MDTWLAVASKRDTRAYSTRPVPDEVERRILDAGRLAGGVERPREPQAAGRARSEDLARSAPSGAHARSGLVSTCEPGRGGPARGGNGLLRRKRYERPGAVGGTSVRAPAGARRRRRPPPRRRPRRLRPDSPARPPS